MNKLELVQRLSRESGVDFDGPTSTLNQVGMFRLLVQWIDTAYEDIQTIYESWQFLQKEFTLALTSGVSEYASSLIPDFGEWKTADTRLYSAINDESYLNYLPWDTFKEAFLIGTSRSLTGRPQHYTTKPDDTFVVHPIPNKSFTCTGEYFRAPHIMFADDDEPIFPQKFHIAIVWRALMLYGEYNQEPDKYTVGNEEYKKKIRMLKRSQLPAMQWAEPLA